MHLKAGVSIAGIRAEMLVALLIAERVYNTMGYELVITSGLEGTHKEGSLHYLGLAIDIRIRQFKFDAELQNAFKQITAALGEEFDVILKPHYLHIEFQPKHGINNA